MLKILSFFLVVLVLALGFSWLVDNPGTVELTWVGVLPVGGESMAVPIWTFLVAQAILIVLACLLAWLVSSFFKAPDRIGAFFRGRRRDKGYGALSAGIIAAGAGDAALARRMTKRSDKMLDARREPLVRFLDAQTAMIEGDYGRARSVFETMERDPETRLLALRGLFLEAERLGDDAAARSYAERAVRIAPHVPWAGGAVLESKTIEGDYQGALAILEAQKSARLVDRKESTRLRAVLLTAQAMSLSERDPEGAKTAAIEAHKLSPALAPAAVAAAKALIRLGDLKRASKILEKTWIEAPHPDIATAYVHARPGDSVTDRMKRARALKDLRPTHVESAVAVAHAALDAQDFVMARSEAMAALEMGPRESIYLLLADIEEAEGGSEGRVREWLGRAIRAPRDPVWTADGYVSETWVPVSPVTGRIDALEWKAPAQRVGQDGTVIEPDRTSYRDAVGSEPLQSRAVNTGSEPVPASAVPPANPASSAEAQGSVAIGSVASAPAQPGTRLDEEAPAAPFPPPPTVEAAGPDRASV